MKDEYIKHFKDAATEIYIVHGVIYFLIALIIIFFQSIFNVEWSGPECWGVFLAWCVLSFAWYIGLCRIINQKSE